MILYFINESNSHNKFYYNGTVLCDNNNHEINPTETANLKTLGMKTTVSN